MGVGIFFLELWDDGSSLRPVSAYASEALGRASGADPAVIEA